MQAAITSLQNGSADIADVIQNAAVGAQVKVSTDNIVKVNFNGTPKVQFSAATT